jgi:hypothetical protein
MSPEGRKTRAAVAIGHGAAPSHVSPPSVDQKTSFCSLFQVSGVTSTCAISSPSRRPTILGKLKTGLPGLPRPHEYGSGKSHAKAFQFVTLPFRPVLSPPADNTNKPKAAQYSE